MRTGPRDRSSGPADHGRPTRGNDPAHRIAPMADKPAAAPSGQVKILVVEDDKFLQKILVTKFVKEGFDVRAASDGEEAMQALLAATPDIVLLDLILPKMSGFDVLTEVKTSPKLKHLPVVILSNLGQEEDIIRAREIGATEFLVKADHSISEVVQRVKEIYARYLQSRK